MAWSDGNHPAACKRLRKKIMLFLQPAYIYLVKISYMKQPALILIASILFLASHAQENKKYNAINLSDFGDAANHWYGINEKGTIVLPRPGHPKYKTDDVVAIADNILLFQKDNGGWPKNYDMQAILTPEQADSVVKAKAMTNTTFDNGTTYPQIAYLSKVFTCTNDDKYKAAALRGLNFIIAAQYANGGWPQYFPLEKNYSRYITFNDDAYCGIMQVLKDIMENKKEYSFIDREMRAKVATSFDKGLDCILKTQLNDDGVSTAWCQQYDEVTLEPAWARKFEPASICNGESAKIVLLLMSIKDPSPAVKDAVVNAVAWFNASAIQGIRVQTFAAPEMPTPYRISKTDKRVVTDETAPQIWTRYYELKTHRPLFCNRDSKVVYSLAEVERERRDGYSWYTYEPQKVINAFEGWKKRDHR